MPKGTQRLPSHKLASIDADREAIKRQIAELKAKLKGELTPAQKLAQEKQIKDQNYAMGAVWRAAMKADHRVKGLFVELAGKLTAKPYDRQVLTELLGPLPDAPPSKAKEADGVTPIPGQVAEPMAEHGSVAAE